MVIEVGKPLPYFCPACQAFPQVGYCNLAGCPTNPAESGAGDGMGGDPSPTGQLRDAKQPPPTNSTEALEALFREAMRIGATSSDLGWRKQQFVREQESRRLAIEAEALASTLREENAEWEQVAAVEAKERRRLSEENARLREAAAPFVAVYRLMGPLNPPDEKAVAQYIPGAWPKMGDLRALTEAVEALTTPSKREDQ